MRRVRLSLVAAIIAVALVPTLSASGMGALHLDFEKEVVEAGVWVGTVEGTGRIETHLGSWEETGSVAHIGFDEWIVGTNVATFVAELSGVLNLKTGNVSMTGVVTDGDFEGSKIHVKALVDLADFSSAGTMTITP